jgi:putative flippase GtrA
MCCLPEVSRHPPSRPGVVTVRVRPLARSLDLIGYLCSADSGAKGQLARYGVAGGLVTAVYVTVTTVLAQLVELPFEVALVSGFLLALAVHFTLQRRFVWSTHAGFDLAMRHQVIRYLTMMGTQYGCTAASTALLPGVLGLPTELIYVATVAVVAASGFLIMRFAIFYGKSASGTTLQH